YAIAVSIKNETHYDCWVYTGPLGKGTVANNNERPKRTSESNPIQAKEIEVQPQKKIVHDSINDKPVVVAKENIIVKEEENTSAPENNSILEKENTKPVGKGFYFKLINSNTGNVVNGEVKLQETERANQYRGYNSNEIVYVVPPNNGASRWIMVCQVVGFKEYKIPFNYNNPQP